MTGKATNSSDVLEKERQAYNAMLGDLEKHHHGKFIVIIGDELVDSFDSFDSAAQFAKEKFGRGPYLIRRVGSPTTMPLPASVAFRSTYAAS